MVVPVASGDSGLSESSESAITLVAAESGGGQLPQSQLKSEHGSGSSSTGMAMNAAPQIGSSRNQLSASVGSNGSTIMSSSGCTNTTSINSQMVSTLGSNNSGTLAALATAGSSNTFTGGGVPAPGASNTSNSIAGGPTSLTEMGHSRNSSNTSQVSQVKQE